MLIVKGIDYETYNTWDSTLVVPVDAWPFM